MWLSYSDLDYKAEHNIFKLGYHPKKFLPHFLYLSECKETSWKICFKGSSLTCGIVEKQAGDR